MWRSTNRPSWHLRVNVIAGSHAVGAGLRRQILRRCGIDAESLMIGPGCFFYGNDIAIGAETWVNHGCYFDTRARIEIGRSCDLGMQVMLCTSHHEVGPSSKRAGPFRAQPIVVEDGVWIGARATILAGVTVGRGCVIAAGAVVNRDCAPDGLYAGVPARRVRDLEPPPGAPAPG
ncbi:MAG: maltose O-acetyltransferase [Thermoleophilaceae bacterium]|nr:maltose O-acetyltransferase [Thermoleophilaceae bacterium]